MLAFSPVALIFFLANFWKPLLIKVPAKSDLIPIEGELSSIGKSKGSLRTESGVERVHYECLCNYGWGENAFQKGDAVSALGQRDGDGYRLWELSVGGIRLFSYTEIATKKLEAQANARSIGLPGIAISLFMVILLGLRRLKARDADAKRKVLFALLDKLEDQEKSDEERLSHLPEILAFDAEDIVGPFEIISMNNMNSDAFLSRMGAELGELWAKLDISELEAITVIQPAAKASAVRVLEESSAEMLSELREVGAV